MKNIEKHSFDKDKLKKRYSDTLECFDEDLDEVKGNYKFLELIYFGALKVIQINSFLNLLTVKETKRYLLIAQKAKFAHIKLLANPGQEVDINLDNSGISTLRADEDKELIKPGLWINAYELGVVLRKNDLNYLNVNKSRIRKISEAYHVVVFYKYFELLKSYMNNNVDKLILLEIKEICNKKFDTNTPPKPDIFPEAYVFQLYQRVQLIEYVINEKEYEFNELLYLALQYHKTIWSQNKGLNLGDVPLKNNSDGFISWPLTSLAAMAYDKGMKIKVESDYMPEWMVKGKWHR